MFCAFLIPSIAALPSNGHILVPQLRRPGSRGHPVWSLDVLAHPADSFVLDSVASVSSEVAYRRDFHNAYFRSRDGKTSLMGGLGRTGKQFGPEIWVQRDPRRSERPTKRPKQLVHGPRGRAPSYSVASAPQRAPPKMNENENLPLLGSSYTNRRKAATVTKGQTSLGGDWTTTARGCCNGMELGLPEFRVWTHTPAVDTMIYRRFPCCNCFITVSCATWSLLAMPFIQSIFFIRPRSS